MTDGKNTPHNVIMENRGSLRISGVKDIDGFTESRIILDTVMGELVIKGEDLHVTALESATGEFAMTGKVCSLTYSRGSLLDSPAKKLFR